MHISVGNALASLYGLSQDEQLENVTKYGKLDENDIIIDNCNTANNGDPTCYHMVMIKGKHKKILSEYKIRDLLTKNNIKIPDHFLHKYKVYEKSDAYGPDIQPTKGHKIVDDGKIMVDTNDNIKSSTHTMVDLSCKNIIVCALLTFLIIYFIYNLRKN